MQIIKAWVARRFAIQAQKKLGQKDILIFINKQGFLYLVLILITFIAGINYANNLILGFCFLLSAILLVSFYFGFAQLYQLQIEVILPEVGQVGRNCVLTLNLQQLQRRARYFYICYQDQHQTVYMDQDQQRIDLNFHPEQRGVFEFPQIKIYSTYPFGLVRAWTYLVIQPSIWIAPKSVDWLSESKQSKTLEQGQFDEFKELKTYQQGDSLQSIAWKQVARGQGLYVKIFEAHADQQHIEIDYARIPAQSHEHKLSLMMGWIEQCEIQGHPYRLVLPKHQLAQAYTEQHSILARQYLAQA